MKKLFRSLIAVTILASSDTGTRRFNVFKSLAPRVLVVGNGRPDLARLTVRDLRKLATTMQIPGRSKARRKADLVALIQKVGAR